MEKPFSIVSRARSFKHAFRGIAIVFKTQHNSWVQGVGAVIVIILGFWLHLRETEWALIVLSITSVIAAEAFNTAIEFDMDLTSPHYHPYARYTKDVAAGAVLLTGIGAAAIGLIILLPKI
jgi:diacylglycerol kinase (ATP)